MAYCTVAQVAAKLQRDIGGDTVPTDDQVDEWIADVDAEINAILRNHGFTPPVDDADGFLRAISLAGASYHTAQAVYTGEGFNDTPRVERMRLDWRDQISTLKKSPNMIRNTSGDFVPDVNAEPAGTVPPVAAPRFTMNREY